MKELLPEKMFTQMVIVLKKFYEFLKLTANVSIFELVVFHLKIDLKRFILMFKRLLLVQED